MTVRDRAVVALGTTSLHERAGRGGRPGAHRPAKAMWALLLLAASGLLATVASGASLYWDAGGGSNTNWSTATNWTSNVEPTSADVAYIGTTTSGGVTPATAVITSTGEACNTLYLGQNAGNSGSLQMSSGDLSVGAIAYVGYSGTGTLINTGGTETISSNLYLGYNASSQGIYTLSNSNLNVGTTVYVGYNGTGTFIQTGGTHAVSSNLYVGYNTGAVGSYTLSDGDLNVGATTHIALSTSGGSSGTGTFTQTGGTHTASELAIGGYGIYHLKGGSLVVTGSVTDNGLLDWSGGSLQVGGTIGNLALGYEAGSDVSYSAPLVQSVSSQYIGYYGRAAIIQPGGTEAVSNLYLGYRTGSEGRYTLSGGDLSVGTTTYVGYSGTGTFTKTGGTHTIGSNLYLGYSANSEGRYTLSDGDLSVASNAYVGYSGTGTFTQTGGTHTAGNLYISQNAGAAGSYTLSGGVLTVAQTVNINAGGQYALEGGRLTAAKMVLNSGSLLHATGGTLSVTALEQRGGTIEGTLENRGTFTYYGGIFNARLVNLGQTIFTVNFTTSGGCENYGTLDVATGRMLTFNGPGMTNRATMTLSGGEVGGPQVFNDYSGTLSGQGTIATGLINNGLVDLGGLLRVTGAISNLGTVSASAGDTLNMAALFSNGGTITLSSGTVMGTGSIRNDPGGTIQGGGGLSVPVVNNGGLIRATQSAALVISNLVGGNAKGGEMAVAANATMRIDAGFANAGIVTLEGAGAVLTGGAIQNTGTIAGRGKITNQIANQGVIRSEGGTLTLSAAGITNQPAGEIQSATGTTVLFSSGLATNAGAISLSGGSLDTNRLPMTNQAGTGKILGYGKINTGGLSNNGMISLADGTSELYGPVTNNNRIQTTQAIVTFYGSVTNAATGVFKITGGRVRFLDQFTNYGGYISDPADNYFTDLNVPVTGYLVGGLSDRFIVSGDFVSTSSARALWDTDNAELIFQGGSSHSLYVTGDDLGAVSAGFQGNFAWGELSVAAGESIVLCDGLAPSGGALYVRTLDLADGLGQIARITGNGICLYYDPTRAGNSYLAGGTYSLAGGGQLAPIPEPATLSLLALLALSLPKRRGLALLKRRRK